MKDIDIVRELAKEYAEFALGGRNAEMMRLMRGVNGLKPARPAVYIDELPWHEMNVNGELDLLCAGEPFKGWERQLRRDIFRKKHFPADAVFAPHIPVWKAVHSTGNGMNAVEDVLAIDAKNHIVAHRYHDQLATEDDLEKLQTPVITHDEAETARRLAVAEEVFNGILPARPQGIGAVHFNPWDDISRYRGVDALLMDLAERPGFMHKIMGRLLEIAEAGVAQYEALGLLQANPCHVHCTAGLSDELDRPEGAKTTAKDVWGRGAAQVFGSVSPDMHDAFDIAYQARFMGKFGLVYYGCCEPLHDRVDKVAKIPNLRKISITPWAKVEPAAEAIGKKYVFAAKPNPAFVAEGRLDTARVRNEIRGVLDACARHGCACEFVLKDISTCGYRPENIFQWEKTVMETVLNR